MVARSALQLEAGELLPIIGVAAEEWPISDMEDGDLGRYISIHK